MRGTYLVCHILKRNGGGDHATRRAKKQTTRAKVATAVYCANGIENDDDNETAEVK